MVMHLDHTACIDARLKLDKVMILKGHGQRQFGGLCCNSQALQIGQQKAAFGKCQGAA